MPAQGAGEASRQAVLSESESATAECAQAVVSLKRSATEAGQADSTPFRHTWYLNRPSNMPWPEGLLEVAESSMHTFDAKMRHSLRATVGGSANSVAGDDSTVPREE